MEVMNKMEKNLPHCRTILKPRPNLYPLIWRETKHIHWHDISEYCRKWH